MKILNPIYDNTFKYLMDNERIAKIVLSIILDTKIQSLQSRPQETPFAFGSGGINISRFDFKAVISDENNNNYSVLIEIQKYKSPNPIGRFRHYLARNYMKEETVAGEKGDKIKHLPIISVYILGFDLPEFSCRAIRVDNCPFDIVNQKPIKVISNFIELLTHKSFILLACNKPNVKIKNTRLEKFLNLFIQKLKGEESNTIVDIETTKETDPDLQLIMYHLNQATHDEELIRKVKAEKELFQSIENLEKKVSEIKIREEKAKAIAEQERIKKQKAEAIAEQERIEKHKAEDREKKAKAQEEKAKNREQKLLKNSVIALNQSGLSLKKIAISLNIDIKIVEQIIKDNQ